MIPYLNGFQDPKRVIEDIKATIALYCQDNIAQYFDKLMTNPDPNCTIKRLRRGTIITVADFNASIAKFLNQWKSHYRKTSTPVLLPALLEAVTIANGPDLPEALDKVNQEHLQIIKHLFNRLNQVPRIGPTTISKLLALLRPSLFMLWDAKIQRDYGLAGNAMGYARFMGVMADFARLLKENMLDVEAYIRDPNRQYITPLAKSLDEWNIIKSKKLEE